MPSSHDSDATPITDRQQLVEYFRRGEKQRDQRGIGTEHEKFVVRRSDRSMLSFDEPGGFQDLYRRLIEQFDWQPAPLDGGNLVSVVRDGSAVTLEPGGQFELSGRITDTVFETADEFDEHLREVRSVADDDLQFTMWGMNPCVAPEDVPWMPKARYDIMKRYLPTRGEMAHWMMKTTCTIQANFDYCSEDDAVELVHTAVLASPIIGALFANSPIQNGRHTDYQSRRNYVWWKHTDPDRTGVPSFMYTTDWGYEDYLNYIIDVPMFFIQRDGELVDMAGHSFRDFLRDGYRDFRPTIDDFELHLSTTFPDVRVKQFVEVRSADGGPREALCALPAVWKGLLYDDQARREVAELFSPLDEDEHRELIETCYRDGLHGDSPYGAISTLATRIVEISEAGLDRIADDNDHRSEATFLTPLNERLRSGRSWADELADDYRRFNGDLVKLADHWAL